MANERLIETFMRELMREFILLCHGNDFEKLTLLKIGDTVERLYEKYGSVDAVPVVHGEWVSDEDDVLFHCSECETQISTSWDYDDLHWNFCPNCGARMDGGNIDGK